MADGSFPPDVIAAIRPHIVEFIGEMIGDSAPKETAKEWRFKTKENRAIVLYKDSGLIVDFTAAKPLVTPGTRKGMTPLEFLNHVGAANDPKGAARLIWKWLDKRGVSTPFGERRKALAPAPAPKCPPLICQQCGGEFKLISNHQYTDEYEALAFRKLRFECENRPNCRNKFFLPYRRENGKWEKGLAGAVLPPYRLADWFANSIDTVHLCEGEKTADALRLYTGKLATSVDSWATKKPGDAMTGNARFFRGFNVVLCPDADEKGLERLDVWKSALAPVAASITTICDLDQFSLQADRLLFLREFYEGGDLADFVDAAYPLKDLYHDRKNFWA